jgi:hypothetical protein
MKKNQCKCGNPSMREGLSICQKCYDEVLAYIRK